MQNTTQASSKSSKAQGGIFEHSGADSLWKMVRSYEIGVKHSATFHQRAGAVLVLEEGIIWNVLRSCGSLVPNNQNDGMNWSNGIDGDVTERITAAPTPVPSEAHTRAPTPAPMTPGQTAFRSTTPVLKLSSLEGLSRCMLQKLVQIWCRYVPCVELSDDLLFANIRRCLIN